MSTCRRDTLKTNLLVGVQLEFASNQTEGERFLASARNDHKQRICHLEPFDFVQGKLRERSFTNGTTTDLFTTSGCAMFAMICLQCLEQHNRIGGKFSWLVR